MARESLGPITNFRIGISKNPIMRFHTDEALFFSNDNCVLRFFSLTTNIDNKYICSQILECYVN